MENQQAYFNCASTIALLEGYSSKCLPSDIICASNLVSLDTRLRRLEEYYNVTPPPPCQAATWDALAHRVFRLMKGYRCPPSYNNSITPNDFLKLISDPKNVSSETLQTLCCDIGYQSFNWPKSVGTANVSDELSVYSQICCYYAGKYKIRVPTIPTTRSEIYGLLVYISVENGPQIHKPFSPPRVPLGVTVVNAGSRPKKPRKRSIFSKFSWLKSLACWRKKSDDDASSIYSSSSSSSSTLGP